MHDFFSLPGPPYLIMSLQKTHLVQFLALQPGQTPQRDFLIRSLPRLCCRCLYLCNTETHAAGQIRTSNTPGIRLNTTRTTRHYLVV